MAIAFVGATNADNSPTINKPGSVVSGNLMIAFSVHYDSVGTTTPSAGWTSQGSIVSTGAQVGKIEIWSKLAGGSEPSSYSFTDSLGAYTDCLLLAYSGAAWDTRSLRNDESSGGTATWDTVAVGASGAVLLAVRVGYNTGCGLPTPGTWTQRAISEGVNYCWERSSVSSGATGAFTATLTSTDLAVTALVSLTPTGGSVSDLIESPGHKWQRCDAGLRM